jgi:hypothetical protein
LRDNRIDNRIPSTVTVPGMAERESFHAKTTIAFQTRAGDLKRHDLICILFVMYPLHNVMIGVLPQSNRQTFSK